MLRKTSVLYFFLSYIVYLLLRREVRVTPPCCRLYTQVGSNSPMCFFISPAYMLSSVLIELHLPYIKAASRRVHGGIRNYLCCLCCRPCLSSRSLVDVFVLGGWSIPAEIYLHVFLYQLFPDFRFPMVVVESSFQCTIKALSRWTPHVSCL